MISESTAVRTRAMTAWSAWYSALTDDELALLSRSPQVSVRAAVAEREATPLTCLIKLAHDSEAVVRAGVARNVRLAIPVEVFEDLARDSSREVIEALLSNPSVPRSALKRVSRSRRREFAHLSRAAHAA